MVRSGSAGTRPSGRASDAIRDAGRMSDFDALRADIREFVTERNWGQFHDPKSLLLALMGEVGELSELVQWLPADEVADRADSEPLRSQLQEEVADVFIYLLHVADALGVDPVQAAAAKLERNRKRFPPASTAGTAPTRS